jgi:hypothetical protein
VSPAPIDGDTNAYPSANPNPNPNSNPNLNSNPNGDTHTHSGSSSDLHPYRDTHANSVSAASRLESDSGII